MLVEIQSYGYCQMEDREDTPCELVYNGPQVVQ
jgi:hypothetical protein